MPYWSLILIWACANNPSALPTVDPDPNAVGCAEHQWGYTNPMFDFKTKVDCDTAGQLATKQPPHVYQTWRCIVDKNKPGWEEEEICNKKWWKFW